jgi:hypothetical protein
MNDAPKKGLSPLAIAGIVIAVVVLAGLATCGIGGWYAGKQLGQVKRNIADGGLVMTPPPAVLAALETDKKDYVGTWTSKSGHSTLTISKSGELISDRAESSTKTHLDGPIAELDGNDIVMKVGLEFRIKVKTPPHTVGSKWEMTADGITWERQ